MHTAVGGPPLQEEPAKLKCGMSSACRKCGEGCTERKGGFRRQAFLYYLESLQVPYNIPKTALTLGEMSLLFLLLRNDTYSDTSQRTYLDLPGTLPPPHPQYKPASNTQSSRRGTGRQDKAMCPGSSSAGLWRRAIRVD